MPLGYDDLCGTGPHCKLNYFRLPAGDIPTHEAEASVSGFSHLTLWPLFFVGGVSRRKSNTANVVALSKASQIGRISAASSRIYESP